MSENRGVIKGESRCTNRKCEEEEKKANQWMNAGSVSLAAKERAA